MPFFLTFFIYVALFILSDLLRPKPDLENAKPAGLGDFDFPTATEGRVVPLIWGTVQMQGPNVIWYGDLRQVPIKHRVKTGMFSSINQVVGFLYYVGIQFGLCRGEIDEIRGVWIGDDRVFTGSAVDGDVIAIDEPDLFGGNDLGQGGVVGNLRVFAGSQTQAVSEYLASVRATTVSIVAGGTGYHVGSILTVVGGTFQTSCRLRVTGVASGAVSAVEIERAGLYSVIPSNPVSVTGGGGTGATFNLTFGNGIQVVSGQTPAYRGTCFALWEGGYVGNSTNIKPWKFEGRRICTGPATGPNEAVNSGNDCNPVNTLYELMTNTDWGLGYLTGDVNSSNFAAAGLILATEGNGFSMLLDRSMEAVDLIKLVEQQIDGVVFLNLSTGKWEINLARGGYDVDDLKEITPSNVVEIKSFARGAWEDTTNQVRVQFNDRADEYKTTFALAQDMANVRLQDGVNVSAEEQYPGVKDRTLANQLAWRDLRTLTYPLAKAQIVVDRTFYTVQPAEVVALTDPDLGFTKLPMRVSRIDLGELEDNRITLDLVQDIFEFQVGAFADPVSTSWTPPADDLQPFPVSEQTAFEAPRGFVMRELGVPEDRIWAGARRVGPEVSFKIYERHAAGTPSGPYAEAGEVFGLLLIGELDANLAAGTALPTTSIVMTPVPDLQTDLEAAFTDGATVLDIGTNLVNLIMVGDELMLPTSAQTSGSNVQMNGVYRGVLDTVQASHDAGTKVWLLFVSGGLTDSNFVPGDNVDVKLLPHSASDLMDPADATAISLQMQDRVRRPYAPSAVSLDGNLFDTSTSLEGTGTVPEDFGILATLNRRDYRTTNEIASLEDDAADITPDFPAANTTTLELDVRDDPNGADTFLFDVSGVGPDLTVLRIDILKETNGILPTRLRFATRSLHLDGGVSYESWQDLVWDFNVTTALTGQFNFAALNNGNVSNVYTAPTSGTYAFTLSTAFTVGNVEYRVNGGSWTPLIVAGATSGSILAVVASDTIEVRHLSTDTNAKKFLSMNAAGAGQDGYAVLFT